MLCTLRETNALRQRRVRVEVALIVAAVLAAPASAADRYESILSGPPQPLTEILPKRVLESIEAPVGPIRVAERPTLGWRPGLSSTEASQATAPEREAAPTAPAQTPKRVPQAPKLVAPKSAESDAGVLLSSPVARPTPDPSVLPQRAPRAAEAAVAPANEEPVPVDARPADEPTEPADDPDTRFAAPTEEPARSNPPADAKPITPAPSAAQKTRPTKPAPSETRRQDKAAPSKPAAKPAAEPTPPPEPLSRSMINLRSRMRTVLSYYYARPLNTAEHDPWEIMHAMLAYELHSRVRDGGPRGPYLTAVGHLCFNRDSRGKRMMIVRDDGTLDVEVGVSLQGHRGQLLAMLAQCNVSPDYPIRVDGREFTIHDLIEAEQRTCYAGTELTFKLIGLGHYLESDAKWTNTQGEAWDIPRLIAEERAQPIRGAACGGTHRLSGLSLAYRRREARDEPVDGEYAEAQKFVAQYQAYAFRLQNDDGSLSTDWFRGPGREADIDRRLRTTGHTLEWLVYALSDEELRSYQTVRVANYLTTLLSSNADHEWHLGSIAHALHALVLYDKRVFRPHDADTAGQVAKAVDPTGHLYREYPIYRGVMQNSPAGSAGLFGIFGGSRTGSAASRRR